MWVALDFLWFPFVLILINVFSRLYGGSIFYPGLGVSKIEELKRITINIIASYIFLFSYLGMMRNTVLYSRFALSLSFFLSLLVVPVYRHVVRYFLRKQKSDKTPVLIAGAGKTGQLVRNTIDEDYYYGLEFKGFLDDYVKNRDVKGTLAEAQKIAKKLNVNYLIVCLPLEPASKWAQMWLNKFQHILLVPDNAVYPILWVYPMTLGHYSGLEISNHLRMKGYRFSKTMIEVILASVIIPCIFPLCLAIAALIKLTTKGPVLYRARRIGQNGKTIKVLKFRTMYQDADARLEKILEEDPEKKKEWEEKFKLKDDPRITPIGKFLRKTSLDELPQFWNVLCGEMAIIGPRPIVKKEIHYYGKNFKAFTKVKPGITGLWQVSGRSNTSYKSRVNLDMYYVNNWSIWMDYFIFLKTIKEVLMRNGAE